MLLVVAFGFCVFGVLIWNCPKCALKKKSVAYKSRLGSSGYFHWCNQQDFLPPTAVPKAPSQNTVLKDRGTPWTSWGELEICSRGMSEQKSLPHVEILCWIQQEINGMPLQNAAVSKGCTSTCVNHTEDITMTPVSVSSVLMNKVITFPWLCWQHFVYGLNCVCTIVWRNKCGVRWMKERFPSGALLQEYRRKM